MTAKEDCEGAAEVPLVPLVADIMIEMGCVWVEAISGESLGLGVRMSMGWFSIYKRVL